MPWTNAHVSVAVLGGFDRTPGAPKVRALAKLMCWNLAGAQARARPMKWLFFATEPGRTTKWTCPSVTTER